MISVIKRVIRFRL